MDVLCYSAEALAEKLTRTGRALLSSGVRTYTWDNRGNLLSDGAFTYTYSAAGRMVQAENLDTTLVYTYNTDGLRIAQAYVGTPGAQTYVWDWATGVPEMLSDGRYTYLVGLDTVGWHGSPSPMGQIGWTYALPDALGSVRQEADANGGVSAAREWSPYGEEIGGAQTGLGFTGEWFDAGVGLTYLRARWYDGVSGRFTSRDAVATSSFYRYTSNNPINRIDPSGYLDWETCTRQGDPRTCTIAEGDRYYQIARDIIAAGIPGDLAQIVGEIKMLNPNYNPDVIYAGDPIKLRAAWVEALRPAEPSTPTPDPYPTLYPPETPDPLTRPGHLPLIGHPKGYTPTSSDWRDLVASIATIADHQLVDTAMAGWEYYVGMPLLPDSGDFMLAAAVQAGIDAPIDDMCLGHRIFRVGIVAIEKKLIGDISLQTGTDWGLFLFDVTLPLGPEVPWLPPVAAGGGFFITFGLTYYVLSEGANYANEEWIFPTLDWLFEPYEGNNNTRSTYQLNQDRIRQIVP